MVWYGELGNMGSCGVSDIATAAKQIQKEAFGWLHIATGSSAISADLRVAGLIGRNPGPDSVSTEPGKTDIAIYFKFMWV